MQEILCSNPPVVIGICDPNKSRAGHHHSKKFVVTGDSLLTGISERSSSRNHPVTIKNFPVEPPKKIQDEMENLVADKLDCIIIHAGAIDITNAINFLNSVKKMVKTVKKNFSKTKFIFSSILIRKKKLFSQ